MSKQQWDDQSIRSLAYDCANGTALSLTTIGRIEKALRLVRDDYESRRVPATRQGATGANLNYCQVCGAWLGMDDYDGICTECDAKEGWPLSFTARELLRCLLNQAFRDGYLDPDDIRTSTKELMRLVDAQPTPAAVGAPVEALNRVTAWVADWCNGNDDGFDDLAADVIECRAWLRTLAQEKRR